MSKPENKTESTKESTGVQEIEVKSIDGEWIDITNKMKGLAKQMRVGEMKMAPDYTLHDSMTALELMSPKMDRGMLSKNYASVEDRHKSGKLPIPPRNMQEAISMLDVLLSMEMAWYSGYSVLNTVYSNVFAHEYAWEVLKGCAKIYLEAEKNKEIEDIDPLPNDESLLAYTIYSILLLTFKISNFIHLLVKHADTYEEEDYAAYIGSFKLDKTKLENIETDVVLQTAIKVEGLLSKVEGKISTNEPSLFTKPGAQVLKGIVQMRRFYLNALVVYKDFDLSSKLFKACLEILPIAGPNRSEKYIAIDEIDECERVEGNGQIYYDSVLCHKMMGSMPPRTVVLLSPGETKTMYRDILEEFIMICDFPHCKSIEEMYRFLSAFSARNPNVVTRSRIINFLYDENCTALYKYEYSDLIKRDMHDFGISEDLYSHELCENFIRNGLIAAIYDIFRICTTNRSRKRRKIVHLLRNWREIQPSLDILYQQIYIAEFEKASTKRSPERIFNTLGCWGIKWTLRLMNEFLLLGFELHLYSIYEIDFIVWYLDYLAKAMADNKKHMETYIKAELAYEESQAKSGNKKKKKKSTKHKKLAKHKALGEINFVEFEKVEDIIYGYLSYGVLCFLLAMRCEDKYTDPDLKFGKKETRYVQRTKPFEGLRPLRPDFDTFQRLFDKEKYSAEDLYRNASESFQKAKETAFIGLKAVQSRSELFEWHVDHQSSSMKGLARAALTNLLCIKSVQAHPIGKKLNIVLDYSAYKGFPVLTIMQR